MTSCLQLLICWFRRTLAGWAPDAGPFDVWLAR